MACFAGTGNGTAKGLYGNIDVVTAALHIIRGQCIIQSSKTNDVHSIYSLNFKGFYRNYANFFLTSHA